jgi:2-C-methyl-D-erythritol 2,4-cyclodiphosphate synthase
MRVGLGYDVHPFGGDGPLVLGGVTIPDGTGLAGHSDADALAHAVADALLGAASLDDLGTLFPASDERWRGVSSMALLADVVDRVRQAGYQPVNVDAVIAAEQPRLAPYIDSMRKELSRVVGAPVNVKPKAGEGVGAVGRSEAIAVWAVALLESA